MIRHRAVVLARKALTVIALGVACCVLGAIPALAQTCGTPTATALAFGEVASQVLASQTVDTTGTITYNCTGGTASTPVRICISLGNFTGSVRTMTRGGAGSLDFQVYQDAARTIVWGNPTTPTIMTIDTTFNASGVASGSVTMYGRILAGQTVEQDGSYTRTMSGGTSQRLTFSTNMSTACTAITGGARTFSFTASATISNLCNVSAATLNFGSTINLTATVDQSSTIQAQCTNSTPYNIGLNAGTGAGATVAARKMTSGGSMINYSLYRDAARSLVWGTTIGTNTISATGNGSSQNHTVYGRVPVQTTPDPGTYSDTINVTVTY
jgi:spore coat protein U-like protein